MNYGLYFDLEGFELFSTANRKSVGKLIISHSVETQAANGQIILYLGLEEIGHFLLFWCLLLSNAGYHQCNLNPVGCSPEQLSDTATSTVVDTSITLVKDHHSNSETKHVVEGMFQVYIDSVQQNTFGRINFWSFGRLAVFGDQI